MIEDRISGLADKIGMKTWYLIVLLMLSFGVYNIVWLLDRYKIFNKMTNDEVVSKRFIVTLSILIGMVPSLRYVGNETIILFSGLVSIISYIMIVYISFNVSKTMENFYAKRFKLNLKFNKFYLLIFHIYYINYCINELVDIEKKEEFLNKNEV